MDNEGVACGDIFEIIFEENTTIIHYQLSIIHSCVSPINGNLPGCFIVAPGPGSICILPVGQNKGSAAAGRSGRRSSAPHLDRSILRSAVRCCPVAVPGSRFA